MPATSKGTQRYFERLNLPFRARPLGQTGLHVSGIGIGGYRITDDNSVHREALRLSLLSGCNLIDTSTNYTDGGSERLIGSVIDELIRAGQLGREEVVVVSKVGYVQDSNLKLSRQRISEGKPFPEMVEYDPQCWHNISPEFIEDQITRSLERLGLASIDVLLLHNPEYYLKAEGDHREYYRRIRRAFEHLEGEVRRGRISCYGISSNTFPAPRESEQYTSLETVWDLAQEIGGKHFAVIQFPMNLFEPGAALEENNSGKSLLEFARSRKLGTLVNRPLNAFGENGLTRLADFPSHDDQDIAGSLKAAWTRAMELESAMPSSSPRWGHILRQNFEKLQDIDYWKATLSYQIEPALERQSEEYRKACSELFACFTAYLENQASYRSDLISSKLDHACPKLHDSQTLSRKVLRLYLSLPGVDCVLIGMRRPEYVRDALIDYTPVSENEALEALRLMQQT